MAEFEILAIGLDEADAPAKFAKSFRETGFAIIKDHNMSQLDILGINQKMLKGVQIKI
jgi:hypothetical protein